MRVQFIPLIGQLFNTLLDFSRWMKDIRKRSGNYT